MITQELVAALDDLIQAGASASASLRSAIDQMAGPRTWESNSLDEAMGTLNTVKTAARTEQSMPTIISSARDAAIKLQQVAQRVGNSELAAALGVKVEAFKAHMKAAGLGTPWLTIIGLGAGAIAAYYFWKSYTKKKSIASFEYPEPEVDDRRPKLMGLAKSLGRFRGAPALGCGKQKRRSMAGVGEKYEFEPETRLEGFRKPKRGGSRRSSK